MMNRLLLLSAPAVGLVGLVFYITVAAPYLLTYQPHPNPDQPIAFSHQVHVQEIGLDCAFCHRTASASTTAGMPDVEQCMFCHQTVSGRLAEGTPGNDSVPSEIEKVRNAWEQQQPIDWSRVHHVPDHTRFPHEAHVQAGVACAVCHGDVAQMEQVEQVRPLNMRDCVECHRQDGAPSQCGVCHY